MATAPQDTTQPTASSRLQRTSWHSDCSNWSLRTRGSPYPSSSTLTMSPGHTSALMISFTDADMLQRRRVEMKCACLAYKHTKNALRRHIRGYGGWKPGRCVLWNTAGVEINPLLLFTTLRLNSATKPCCSTDSLNQNHTMPHYRQMTSNLADVAQKTWCHPAIATETILS